VEVCDPVGLEACGRAGLGIYVARGPRGGAVVVEET